MQRSLRPPAVAVAALLLFAPATLAASPSPHAHGSANAVVDFGSPAAQLRVDLDRLLAEHAFLTIEQMRSGLAGSADFAAAAAAVEANSVDVTAAIASVYGPSAADPFGDIWRSHIGYLVDYAIALRAGDETAQQAARSGLATYRSNLHTFLGDANPGIDLSGIAEALDMHTAQLLEFIETEAELDHEGAYALEREAYPHMFHVGDALAKVIANSFPDRYPGVDGAYSAAGTLRITLDRLLAEHAFLAAEAMRSGVSGAPDFDAAKGAIDANSGDLEDVVAAAYGDGAAAEFRALWDNHIAAYVAYIDATRANDPVARSAASGQITAYAAQLASFLAAANPYLNAAALATLFQEHAGHLIAQVEAYAAADYDTTYALVREAYQHMFTAGEALALAIATQMPEKFPADAPAPNTATEPEAAPDVAALVAFAVGLGVVVLTIVALLMWPGLRGRRHFH
jgi:hypothetical protein